MWKKNCGIYRLDSYNRPAKIALKVAVENNLSIMSVLKHSNTNNVCVHFQNVIHNLQTRKNSEMVQTTQIELSKNNNTTRSLI